MEKKITRGIVGNAAATLYFLNTIEWHFDCVPFLSISLRVRLLGGHSSREERQLRERFYLDRSIPRVSHASDDGQTAAERLSADVTTSARTM